MTLGVLPRMRHQGIGDMHVFSLLDSVGSTREPRGMLSGWVDGMAKGLDWLSPDYLDPQGRMVMAYQSFLLRTPDLSILIDCAVGEDGTFPARPDWHQRKSNWMAHLGQAGLTPDDVDVVFLTHLHPDHTGWLTRLDAGEWTPTFPRARHVTSACEIEHWSANHASVPVMGASWSDSVAPVLARFETVATGDTLAPGLEVVDLAGHSPGMIGLELVQSGTVRAAFNADLMHHPLQMAHPELATIFCSDPAAAIAVRRDRLARYAADGTVMFCNHFPGESAGRAVPEGNGYRFMPWTDGPA